MAITPPTLIADNEGASWDTTTSPKTTASFNSAVGDVWVTGTITESNSMSIDTPTNTGTAQTFTARGTVTSANYCEARAFSTVVANTLTAQTVSAAKLSGTTVKYGMNVVRFSGSDGIGAVPAGEAETDGTAPSLTITTTGDNSAIVVFVGDFNAADGASRTWRTVNGITPTAGNGGELTYFRNAANYTVYVGYYSDAGAAGAKTVGLSAPTGMKASIVAVEVLGTTAAAATAAGRFPSQAIGVPFTSPGLYPVARPLQLLGDAPTPQFPSFDETGAGADSAAVAVAVPLAETAAADDAAVLVSATPLAETATGTDTATVAAAIPLAETASGTDVLAVTVPVSLTDTAAADDGALSVAPAVPLPETAAASDVIVLAAAVAFSDTATGDDSLSVQSDAVITTDPNQAKPGFPAMLTSLRTSAGQVFGDAATGGNQAITLSDTATGTDTLAVAAATPLADTAAGTDSTLVSAAVPLSDGANSDDSLSVLALGSIDAFQASPAIAWMFTSPRASTQQVIGDTTSVITMPDTVTSSDALTVAIAVPVTDTAAATDSLTVVVTASLSETAGATDAVTVTATTVLADTATAVDSVTVQPDASSQDQATSRIPGMAISPRTAAAQLYGDASTGAAPVSMGEMATADDSLAISVTITMADTAAAVDSLTPQVGPLLAELVSAADALAIAVVLGIADTASAVDDLRIGGQGIQGQGHGHGPHSSPGNVYPKSSAAVIIGSVG